MTPEQRAARIKELQAMGPPPATATPEQRVARIRQLREIGGERPDRGSPEGMLADSLLPRSDPNKLPWETDTLTQRVVNPFINAAKVSLPKTVSSLYHAVANPVETVSGLGKLMLGAYGGIGPVPGNESIPQEYKDAARGAVTPEHSLMYTLATDPVGVAATVLPFAGPNTRVARALYEAELAARKAVSRPSPVVPPVVTSGIGSALKEQLGFGGRSGAEKAAYEPFDVAMEQAKFAADLVPGAGRAVTAGKLKQAEVGQLAVEKATKAESLAAALQTQGAKLPSAVDEVTSARLANDAAYAAESTAKNLLDENMPPVLPTVPSRTAVGESAQQQVAAAKKTLEETNRAEAATARAKVDRAADNLESTGVYIGETPAARDLLVEIQTDLKPRPSSVSTTAMRPDQLAPDVVTFKKQVEAAIRDKKVFLNEAEAAEAKNLGYKVDLEQAAKPSYLGKDGNLISSEAAVYSRTLKSAYEAVDNVGRFLGQVYEGTAARGYDAIAAEEARRLYGRIQEIKSGYLPENVQAEYNATIRRHKGLEDRFSRQGGEGGAVKKAGDIERLENLPLGELDKITSGGVTSVENYARVVGADRAASLVETEIYRKLSDLNSTDIAKTLKSDKPLGDIFTNLDRLGQPGVAARDRIQGYIDSVSNREKLVVGLKDAGGAAAATRTGVLQAEAALSKTETAFRAAERRYELAQKDVGATERTIETAADNVDKLKVALSKAKDEVAKKKNDARKLNPANARKDVDALIGNLRKNLEERRNLDPEKSGANLQEIERASTELDRVEKIRNNVSRNKRLAKLLAVYGGVPVAGVYAGSQLF